MLLDRTKSPPSPASSRLAQGGQPQGSEAQAFPCCHLLLALGFRGLTGGGVRCPLLLREDLEWRPVWGPLRLLEKERVGGLKDRERTAKWWVCSVGCHGGGMRVP